MKDLDDKQPAEKPVEDSPSAFTVAMERKLSATYEDGYHDGAMFIMLAFVMAIVMTIALRKLQEI